MKKLFLLFLLASCFLYGETLRAQLRSDFVLADSAVGGSIRLDGEGNLHAVWRKADTSYGAENAAYYAAFDSMGLPILAPARVSISNNIWFPRIALLKGHAIVVWEIRGSLDADEIEANVLDLSEEIVPRNIYFAGGDTYSPDVAYLNDTTFIVVWIGEGSFFQSDFQLYGQIATNSLIFQGGHILLDDPEERGVRQFSLRVVARPERDDFLIVWLDDRSGSFRAYGRLFNSNGSPVGSSFLISEDQQLTWLGEVSVAVNDSGEFGVVWAGETDSNEWVVQMRRLGVDGTPLGPSIRVDLSAHNSLFTDYPDISFDRDGTFIVVWDMFINGISKIYAQRFESDWTPLGVNFRVSSVMDSSRQYFSSVLLRNGRIYTTWTSAGDSTAAKLLSNIIDFYDPPNLETQSEPILPLAFSLHQNYPNPFNAITTIVYEIKRPSRVRLVVYNILGEEVTTLVRDMKIPGVYESVWDGKDRQGMEVSSGVYLYQLMSDGQVQTKKMVLLK